MEDQVTRGAIGMLAAVALATLACILLSLDRGLELADESAYIYLLAHPDLVLQFVDHRLWGALGGSVAFYRALALALTTASAAFVAAGALRALGMGGRVALFVHLATLVGAVGYFAVIRPTMNYGTTGLVFGNLIIGLLLHDLARPGERRPPAWLPLLLGVAIALLALARFTAVPAYLLIVLGYAGMRSGSVGARIGLVVGTLLATAAALALLEASGFAIVRMLEIGTGLTGGTHRISAFVPRDLLLIALMGGVGCAGAGAVMLAERWGWSRSVAFGGLVALMLAGAVVDQRAVIMAPAPGPSPFATNVNLYGTTYVFYALAALLTAMLALDDLRAGREGWRGGARLWTVLLLLGLACACPFLGTNTGILARSGLNAGPLFAGIALAALACARRGLIGDAAGRGTVAGVAALAALWVFLNTIWSPYGINGGWSRQIVRLDAPAAVAGLRVSPGTAMLARDLRGGLARLGFDPARDRLLFGYGKPGLALLAGGEIAGLPFAPDHPGVAPLLCAQIAEAVAGQGPRRLYGLNLDYRSELTRCLAGRGIDLSRATRHRVSPLVTIAVLPLS